MLLSAPDVVTAPVDDQQGLEPRTVFDRLNPEPLERRREQRDPFRYVMRLTALEGADPVGEPMYVVGRDLTPFGIGFEHPAPLPHRRVRLSAADAALEDLGLGDLELEVVLRWCRFLEAARYESGGRITQASHPLK